MDIAMLSGLGLAVSAVLGGVIALVRIAVNTAERRADDWRKIAEDWRETARTAIAASAVNAEHVKTLMIAVERLTASQTESMTILRENLGILRELDADRRGAA